MSRCKAHSAPGSVFRSVIITVIASLALVFAMSATANAAVGVSAFSLSPSSTASGANPDLLVSATRSGSPDDDLKQVALKLPVGATYSVAAVGTKCTSVQFNADACPASSIVGAASARAQAGLLGFVLFEGDISGTIYATSSTEVGVIYRPAGFQKIFVKAPITGTSATGVTLTVGDYKRTNAFVGLIPLDITINRVSYLLNGKSGATPLYKNPTTCGAATSTITFVPFSGSSASRTSSYTVTGCTGGPDTTPPVISSISPASGTSTTASSVVLTYTATDNSGVAPTCSPVSGSTVALSLGANPVVIGCSDGSGNNTSTTVTYTRVTPPDTTDPVVHITSPSTGTTTAESATLTFTVTDNDASTTCNQSNGSPVPLSLGSNVITVTCTDTAGNSGSDSVTVTRVTPPDTTDPVVDITSPSAGTTTDESATLTFTVTDNDAATTCDATSGSTVALSLGSNVITVTCTDTAGNAGTDSVTVVRNAIPDTSDPVVDISSPSAGTTTDESATLSFTVTDNDPAVSCDATDGSTVALSLGSNVITVTCTDTAGNSGSDSVTVTRVTPPDTTDPVVDITSPSAGITTDESATLTFTVTDNDAATTCDATSGSTVALSLGTNVITVTCTDTAGNSGTDSVTVTRTNVPDTSDPVVDITSPSAGTTTDESVTLTFTVTDNDAATTCDATSGSTVALSLGSNVITVTCTDSSGNEGSDSVTVTRVSPPDTTDPVVDITSPVVGTTTDESATLTFTVTDNDPATTCDATSGSSVALSLGSNVITVTCTDTAGNSGTDSVTVTRTAVPDTTDPVVDITSPSAGTTTDESATLSFTVTDNDAATTCDATSGSTVALSLGSNVITVTCTDTAGNEGSDSVTVTRVTPPDTTDPVVDITSPSAGTTTDESATLTFTVTDNDAATTCDATSGSTVALTLGTNVITVTCTDTAGNSGTDSVTVVRTTVPDTTDPVVDITSPSAGTTTDESVTLAFSVTDVDPATTCDATSGSTLALSLGANVITVTCTDTAGNSGSDSVTVTRVTPPDTTDPVVDITSPSAGTTTDESATLTFTVTDNDAATTCDATSGSTVALSLGSNVITVTCTDTAGNSGSDSVTVTRVTPPDTTDPVVDITSPSAGTTTDESATLTFTVTDNDAATTCDATSGSTVALSLGSNVITVTCTDTAGNSGTDSVTVTRTNVPDTTDPVVDITSPSAGTTTDTSATLTFTVTDNDAATTCDATSGSTVALSLGSNVITVTCTDTAGNSGSDSVTVTRVTPPDTTDPVVDITSPVAGTTTASSVTLSFTVTDNDPATSCDQTDGSTVALSLGSNVITVTCTDTAGNSGTDSVTVTREDDTPPPSTSVADPLPAAPTLTPTFAVSSDAPTATFECSINDGAFADCDPNAGTYADTFNDADTNKVAIRAKVGAAVDATPAVQYIWTDTADPTADATITASDTAAGAHPDIDSTIVLHGGYNPKSVTINMPFGFNGALTATDEVCTIGDATVGDCGTNAPGSLIGTLTGDGVSVRDGYLTGVTGNLYLTEPPTGESPAGVALDMESPNGLGFIRAIGEVHITQTPNGVINGETRQQIVIPSIPQRTDIGNRFHANTVQLHLDGNPAGGTYPLLTNPTTCPDPVAQFSGEGTTYGADGDDASDGPAVAPITVDYPVTDCDTLEFDPQINQEFYMPTPIDGSTYDPTNPGPSLVKVDSALTSNRAGLRKGQAGTVATLDMGAPSETARRAAIRDTEVYLPTSIGANLPAFGDVQDMCSGSSADAVSIFDPSSCPAIARVGKITIQTPLLADPLVGDVYAINKVPIPWIGIDINPDVASTNPVGVTLRLTGRTSTEALPGCSATAAPWCGNRVKITLSNLPDVPMTNVVLDMSGRTARPTRESDGGSLATLPLITADGGDTGCKPNDQIISSFISGAAGVAPVTRTQDTTMSYCVPPSLSTITRNWTLPATGAAGTVNASLTSPQVSLAFTAEATGVTSCSVNGAPFVPCVSGFAVPGLVNGSNTVIVRVATADGFDENRRTVTWNVDAVAPAAPTLARSSANGAANATFTWTRAEAGGNMQCSRDGAAFSNVAAQCGTGALTGTSGTQTWTAPAAGAHTFAMRQYDAVGNIGTAASVAFTQ